MVSNRGPDLLGRIFFSKSDCDTLQHLIDMEKYPVLWNRMCRIIFCGCFGDFAIGILFKKWICPTLSIRAPALLPETLFSAGRYMDQSDRFFHIGTCVWRHKRSGTCRTDQSQRLSHPKHGKWPWEAANVKGSKTRLFQVFLSVSKCSKFKLISSLSHS